MNFIILIYRRLYWRLFTDTRCAWCRATLRPAWITTRRHSDGICPACAAQLRRTISSANTSV